MALQQNIDHARSTHFAEVLPRTADALAHLRKQHADGSLPLLRLPERHDDIATLLGYATLLRDNTTDVIFLGTGGSSLGGQTLAQLDVTQAEAADRVGTTLDDLATTTSTVADAMRKRSYSVTIEPMM